MGPDNAELNEVNKSVYLRDVKAADFQTTSPVAQPLLVDIEHLSGHPLLEVKVDGKKILEQRLEKGRYILEAPNASCQVYPRPKHLSHIDPA